MQKKKKIPARTFLTRALLTAETFVQAQEMMRDRGCGVGDGVSVNMTFLKQEGDRLFHNAEVAPPAEDAGTESGLNIFTASPGETIHHTNRLVFQFQNLWRNSKFLTELF